MPLGRRSRRERITAAFDEFRAAAGAALGAAARLRDAAVRAQAETMFELWLRRDGIEAARADPALEPAFGSAVLAGAVERAEKDRREAFEPWLRDGPRQLTDIMAAAATGAAGRADQGWVGEVGTLEGVGAYPRLWRLGDGRLEVGDTFPVGVPLLDEAHLRLDSTHETRGDAEALVEQLLLRLLSVFRPGSVNVHVWDVGQFTGALPGLYPLTRTGLLTVHDPGSLGELLGELSDRIRKVHSRVLVGGYPSLRAHAEHEGKRSEPWVVAVLAGNRQSLSDEDHRQLQRVARSGLACGIQLVLLDVPMTVGAPVESVRFTADGVRCSMTGPHVAVTPDPPLRRDAVTTACTRIVEAHERLRAEVRTFADLLPPEAEWFKQTTVKGVQTQIGFTDGMPVELMLDDGSPHALIGGPSGSGKTNLLLTMIGSMAARHAPSELEFYLLDFKEGVSFAQFAPGRRDGTWLPHARLVGINVNTDREFGLALLQFLADEMRRRSEVAKEHEVTKLEELRDVDEAGRWPRIVAVIDEFQYLFAERDQLTKQATSLLEDVARRGRSQGIHLVLASQDVSGIEAFWGRPGIFEQFVLRIALPRARRVLANLNDAALSLPRWHAIVNHESGIKHGNEIARIPDAGARTAIDDVQRASHGRFREEPPPRLFDGARPPKAAELVDGLPRDAGPLALVGQLIDVRGTAASVRLPDSPGRNIAVLGSDPADAVRVVASVAAGLARTAPGTARFRIVSLVAGGEDVSAALLGREQSAVSLGDLRADVERLATIVSARASEHERPPIYYFLLGADAADPLLERPGTEALRSVLRFGPEVGVHVVGWWRSAARLRSLLSLSASPDDVGAWIALDVQGSELNPLAPGMGLTWAPRPGRGLFFDRAQHSRPEVVLVPEVVSP
ncbi:MAG: FtsK/SpoIIIE domain-containing protein [Pseudonocardia sp.]|nr:FtsK/SpoIIIE domain-containing protein [Pseudonocardia sp.]